MYKTMILMTLMGVSRVMFMSCLSLTPSGVEAGYEWVPLVNSFAFQLDHSNPTKENKEVSNSTGAPKLTEPDPHC